MKKTNIFSQLSLQRSAAFSALRARVASGFERYPRLIFFLMLLLMASSAVLCFTLLRSTGTTPAKAVANSPRPLQQAREIYSTATKLATVIEMQAELKGLLSQKQTLGKDSARIAEMILKINELQTNTLPNEKDKP